MSLFERLAEYVRAYLAGIWVQSHEHDDALLEISRLCRQEERRAVREQGGPMCGPRDHVVNKPIEQENAR